MESLITQAQQSHTHYATEAVKSRYIRIRTYVLYFASFKEEEINYSIKLMDKLQIYLIKLINRFICHIKCKKISVEFSINLQIKK